MRKLGKPWSLKTLFALSSTACVFFTVIIGYFGLTAYAEFQLHEIKAGMPPAALSAQNKLDARKVPTTAETQALIAFSETIDDNFEIQQNVALVILSVFAATLGAGLSVFLADRLARPIAEVAGAARRIAKGDLSARAHSPENSIGESAQLTTDFNQMAAALEAFDREMTESSAAIAHELRTPLTVLRGYVQGSIDGLFPPTHEHLSRLMVHIESLSRVVDDLQTLSLAKNGALTISVEKIDAAEEIDRLLDAMEPAISANGMRFDRGLEAAPVMADPVRLRQAVSALIDNACRYALGGEVIRVQTRAVPGGIKIHVLDRGCGMTETQLTRSFDRFWRGEPSRGKTSGGSGLGLSVVKAIVTSHGGEVRITNRPSGGLSVELSLPNAVPQHGNGQISI
jgi:two-component system, OmpR family, sensor histidine kinase AdeS